MSLGATRKPLKSVSGKPRKCAVRTCRASFVPTQSFQSWCSPECGVQISRDKQQKERKALDKIERKAIRDAKERIKSRGDYLREAQAVINRYVRLRDSRLGCVSCERPATWQGQWHASHYRSRGAAPHLRFNLHNIHKACSICNNGCPRCRRRIDCCSNGSTCAAAAISTASSHDVRTRPPLPRACL